MRGFFGHIFSRQFFLFFIFGGLAALVNLAVGKLLYDILFPGMYYTVSVFIAAFCGLFVNFACNYTFNFTEHPRKGLEHFRTFFVVAVIGTFLTALFSRIFLSFFTVVGLPSLDFFTARITNRFLAHFLAVGVVFFYSYFAHKYISFSIGFRGQTKRIYDKYRGGV